MKNEKKKRCKSCDFCTFFWYGIHENKKQYYCKWKLNIVRHTIEGRQDKSYIKPMDEACEEYFSSKEGGAQ